LTRAHLVTGGAGFIGKALTRQLVASGSGEVRVLDVRPRPADLPAEVDYRQGSVLDPTLLEQAMSGCERVFHLAGTPELWLADKSAFHTINTEGTRRVLQAAEHSGVARLVFTSTESIIVGTRAAPGTIREDTSAALEDMPGPYCRSKFLAEQAALAAAARGLPVVVVNPTLPIGPGDDALTPPTRMLLGYLNGELPAFLDSAFNLVHVDDVARGHLLAAERGRSGERYILGAENWRLSELLAALEAMTGVRMPRRRVPYALALGFAVMAEAVADHLTRRRPVAPLTGVRLARRPMHFDTTKARTELGLQPRPIEGALAETIVWMADAGLLRDPQIAAPLRSAAGSDGRRPAAAAAEAAEAGAAGTEHGP